MRTLCISGFAALALTLFASPALAEPTRAEQAAAISDEAVELYGAHDYARAIEKFAQAYVLDPDPNLLYNQGRCYDALGDRPSAYAKYKEFLQKSGGELGARKKAQAFLDDFDTLKAKAPEASASGSKGGPAAPATGTSPAPQAKSALPTVGWVLVGVGAAGVAAGAVTGLLASSKNSDAAGHCRNGNANACDQTALDLTQSAKSYATLSTVAFVAGGLFVAGGITLVVLAPSSKEAPSQATARIAPVVTDRYAGFQLAGQF